MTILKVTLTFPEVVAVSTCAFGFETWQPEKAATPDTVVTVLPEVQTNLPTGALPPLISRDTG